MTTCVAPYDGSNFGAMTAATGSHTTTLTAEATNPPLLSNSNPYRGSAALRWDASKLYGFQNVGAATNGWFRQYLRILGTPTGRFSIAVRAWSSTDTADDWFGSQNISIGTDKKLSLTPANTGFDIDAHYAYGVDYPTFKATGATVIPNDQWVRIEGRITPTSLEAKLWLNPASTGTPDENLTLTDVWGGSYGQYEAYWIGAGRFAGAGWTTFTDGGNVVEIDEFAFDTAGYPGPIVGAGTSYAGIVRI
jgi:hypothetical protein